ncbi:hypothetical protein [Gemmobacter caeruleus]|uniref:hypothetical protein n=1 Tax=Gemmobacter caeruleus TaxID=2595004 RepID=UPI0011F08BD5|nr:hypothetical protein [Gemmobacter caeruleus]
MQVLRTEISGADLVGWGVRVLLVAQEGAAATDTAMKRVAGMGGQVDLEGEFFAGLSALMDDPRGYGLFVLLCDDFGGLEAGHRAVSLLRGAGCTVPCILVASGLAEQSFPEHRDEPVLLRAPLSAVSLRVGFEHALRERMLWSAA